ADMPGIGQNLSNHAILFVGLHLPGDARQAHALRPHPTTAWRYSSGLAGAPPSDMYLNVQNKTAWSRLGHQVANLSLALLKPMARGHLSLASPAPERPPQGGFNFTRPDPALPRTVPRHRRLVETTQQEAVQALSRTVFPVRFSDRLRRLNQYTSANVVASSAIAKLLDLVPALGGPIFSTLADRRVDLPTLVADEAVLAEHIRDNVGGMFHPVGTCRMGAPNDRMAVVDPAGNLRGFAGLRVIAASIMPTLPRGNANIPTIMVAEKVADAIVHEVRAAA